MEEFVKVKIIEFKSQEEYMSHFIENSDQNYQKYLSIRKLFENNANFYVDVSTILYNDGQIELSLRVLSNLAELELENPQLLRIYGE